MHHNGQVPCAVALVLAVATALDGGSLAAPDRPLIRFSGNQVMPDEVYLTVLHLPEDAQATLATALEVEQALSDFLHQAGYELSSVSAQVEGEQIAVLINEGQLEKVVFRGRLTLQTLRFKLALVVPFEVFNRPALERQMQQLALQLKVEKVWFELVRTAEVAHLGPQLEELPAIQGVQLIHARRPFELHVFFEEKEWDEGLGLDLRSGYIDGLELGVNFQGRNGLLKDDGWRVAASGGAGLRRRISDDRFYAAFTRAYAELRWFSPRLIGNLRPFVWLQGDLLGRQRADLHLENYNAATSDVSIHLALEPREGLLLSLGGGYEWRRIYGLQVAPGFELSPLVVSSERLRPFGLLRVKLVYDTGADRSDRRHALTVDVRQYLGLNDPWFGYAAHRYSRVISFGWHDLWIRSRSKFLWGEVAFHNEEPVGEYLTGSTAPSSCSASATSQPSSASRSPGTSSSSACSTTWRCSARWTGPLAPRPCGWRTASAPGSTP